MLPITVNFIAPDLPEAVKRRLVSMLFDAPASTVVYIVGLIVMTAAIWWRNGDAMLTATAICCVVINSMRVAYVAIEKPKLDQPTPWAYLPALFSFGVAYSAAMAALVVRAFAIGDAVDIALVGMAASGYLAGLTIRAAAVPSLAIVQTLAMFMPMMAVAFMFFDYWAVGILSLCHTAGSINLIMTMNRRILSQLIAEHDLAHRAATDTLTEAVSRVAFDDAVTDRLAAGSPIVAIVDLDNFKLVNDTYGHATGDELLIAAVDRMVSTLAASHIVGRIGGDEFAVLFAGTGVAGATRLAEMLVTALEQPFTLVAGVVQIGASIGMAVAIPGDTAQSLRQRADGRLYDAKRGGRGRVAPAQAQDAA